MLLLLTSHRFVNPYCDTSFRFTVLARVIFVQILGFFSQCLPFKLQQYQLSSPVCSLLSCHPFDQGKHIINATVKSWCWCFYKQVSSPAVLFPSSFITMATVKPPCVCPFPQIWGVNIFLSCHRKPRNVSHFLPPHFYFLAQHLSWVFISSFLCVLPSNHLWFSDWIFLPTGMPWMPEGSI